MSANPATDRLQAILESAEAAAPTSDLARAAGYRLEHNGGNCVAWMRRLDDGTALLICTEDSDVSAAADDAVWIIGRHSQTGEGGFTEADDAVTFGEALALAPLLPTPIRDDGSEVQKTYAVDALRAFGAP